MSSVVVICYFNILFFYNNMLYYFTIISLYLYYCNSFNILLFSYFVILDCIAVVPISLLVPLVVVVLRRPLPSVPAPVRRPVVVHPAQLARLIRVKADVPRVEGAVGRGRGEGGA